MEDKYKYMFLRYIYKIANLGAIETKLEEGKVVGNIGSSPEYPQISKYFSLMNEVDTSKLNIEQKNQFESYFSQSLNELCKPDKEDEINKYLMETYKTVLFPDIEAKTLYYGPVNDKYIAPRDAVVLGFNYRKFDIPDDENFDKNLEIQDSLICSLLNYIQSQIGPAINMKIAVLKYNELLIISSRNDFNKSL